MKVEGLNLQRFVFTIVETYLMSTSQSSLSSGIVKMYRSIRTSVLVILLAVMCAGCTTFSGTVFLIQEVDNRGKSRILTETGEELYACEIVSRENYAEIEKVRKYFVVALRFHPENTAAQESLKQLQEYRETRLKEKMAQFRELSMKKDRTEEQNYTLCLLAQQCVFLDPGNQEARELRDVASETRIELLRRYRERSAAAIAAIKEGDSMEKKESLYVAALESIHRALSIDPGNWDALPKKRTVNDEMEKILAARAEGVERAIEEEDFEGAETQIGIYSEINALLDYCYDEELKRLQYALYFRWARFLIEKSQFDLAEAKIDLAIVAESTDEARSIREQILSEQQKVSKARAAQKKNGRKVSGDEAIKEIELLVDSGELSKAYALIVRRLEKESDRENIQRLNELQGKIRGWVKWYYDLALAYYRQENFSRAVELFTRVVEIDRDYEMAQDYLDKAKSKQKLIESLGLNS